MAGFSDAIVQLSEMCKEIGATPFVVPKHPPVTLTGTITSLINQGKIENVRPDSIICSPEGEVLFLYIPDHTYMTQSGQPDTPENRNKVHLFYCHTLRDMEDKGRKYRYVATNNTSGNFDITYSKNVKSTEHLNVCQNCFNLLKRKLYGPYTKFDFAMFANEHNYSPPWFKGIPKTIYDNDYPDNWREISYKIRNERDWKCEECGKDFSHNKSGLDLHHINGIKSDCSRSNLRALCRNCHKKQPGHEHMSNIY